MLVLSRRPGQSVVIQGGIRVTVASIKGNNVRLSFDAPPEVVIDREEVARSKAAIPPSVPACVVEWSSTGP